LRSDLWFIQRVMQRHDSSCQLRHWYRNTRYVTSWYPQVSWLAGTQVPHTVSLQKSVILAQV